MPLPLWEALAKRKLSKIHGHLQITRNADRDDDGNTILHYAAWTGNIYLARSIFDSAKAKKLISVANKNGAIPLALAIIASQVLT